jgi:hypothetical protein
MPPSPARTPADRPTEQRGERPAQGVSVRLGDTEELVTTVNGVKCSTPPGRRAVRAGGGHAVEQLVHDRLQSRLQRLDAPHRKRRRDQTAQAV